MNKTIADIRYFASEHPNRAGQSLPADCSVHFTFPKLLHYWGRRIAKRLANYDFSAGSFDHLYINYSNCITVGQCFMAERSVEKWLCYVDYGVSHQQLQQLDEMAIEQFIINSTFIALALCCADDPERQAILETVKAEVMQYQTELLIDVKAKETQSYSVCISHKIRPHGEKSCGVVTWRDHKSGVVLSGKFIELNKAEDIFPLTGSITVKDNKITIKPRASFRAELYTRHYTLPLVIDIQELTAV